MWIPSPAHPMCILNVTCFFAEISPQRPAHIFLFWNWLVQFNYFVLKLNLWDLSFGLLVLEIIGLERPVHLIILFYPILTEHRVTDFAKSHQLLQVPHGGSSKMELENWWSGLEFNSYNAKKIYSNRVNEETRESHIFLNNFKNI